LGQDCEFLETLIEFAKAEDKPRLSMVGMIEFREDETDNKDSKSVDVKKSALFSMILVSTE
jgi:hypothetical protein